LDLVKVNRFAGLKVVKINRCAGLKVVKKKENLGTKISPSCWLLLAKLLALEISGFSSTYPRII